MKKTTQNKISKIVRKGVKATKQAGNKAAAGAASLSKKAVRIIKKNAPSGADVRRASRATTRVVMADALAMQKKFGKIGREISAGFKEGMNDAKNTKSKKTVGKKK